MFIAQKGGTGHRPKCFGLCDPNRLCVHLEGRAGGIVRSRYNCQLTFAPLGAEWTVGCDFQQLEATQSPQQPILQPLMSGYERGVDHRSLFALIFTFHFRLARRTVFSPASFPSSSATLRKFRSHVERLFPVRAPTRTQQCRSLICQ